MDTPHVAKFLKSIDPSTDAQSEGEERLKRIRCVIPIFGASVNFPGLGSTNACDSIGRLLNPANPEPYRRAIMQAADPDGPPFRVFLSKPQHQILSADQADALDPIQRSNCVALKNTPHVALKLGDNEKNNGKVRIEFKDKALVVLWRPDPSSNPMLLELVCTAVNNGARRILSAVMDDEHKPLLDALFHDRSTMLTTKFNPPLRSKFIATSLRGFWDVPPWLADSFCTIFQDLYRVTPLIKASCSPSVSRPLQVENVRFFRKHDPSIDSPPLRVLLRGTLHPCSQTCICSAHLSAQAQASKGPPKSVQLDLEMCGMPLNSDGKCPIHRNEDAHLPFPGATVCTRNLKAKVGCRHENGQSLTLDFPPDLWSDQDTQEIAKLKKCNKLQDVSDVRSRPKAFPILSSLVSIACVMCTDREVTIDEAKEHKERCAALMTQLDHAMLRRGFDAKSAVKDDLTASRLIRTKQVRVEKTQTKNSAQIEIKRLKSSGETLTQSEKNIVATHGHLFPRF